MKSECLEINEETQKIWRFATYKEKEKEKENEKERDKEKENDTADAVGDSTPK